MKLLKSVILFLVFISTVYAKELKVGDKAPDFTLQDSNGKSYSLSSYKGSPVVVYFYPQANTSGCTKQACGIRDNYSKFKENKIMVFGISVDSKDDLKKFVKNNNLNFTLLSDADKKVSKKYDVLNLFGKDYRITFIIDKDGKVSKIMRDIDISSHATDVLTAAVKLK